MHGNLIAPVREVAAALKPRPRMTVSEWADAYRHMSSLSSPEPGRWRTDRVPYLREVMDCMSLDSGVEWLVFRTGTQVGKSEALNNAIGYRMHWAPCPIVMVQPTESAAEDYSTQRVDDLIKSSPVLRRLVGGQHTKDADGRKGKDAVAAKAFPGGMLFIVPATSKPALASKPAGVVLFDELNRAPRELAGEGSPVSIVEHRTQNFVGRIIVAVSTPTDEGDSPICDLYEQTDKRIFELPCPECGAFQELTFFKRDGILGGVVWPDGAPAQARYECAHCGALIGQDRRAEMLAAGRWEPTAESKIPNARGYALSALYSPWVPWSKLATKFVLAKGDPVKMRDFVTLDLAKAWKHASGEAYAPGDLQARAVGTWGSGQRIEVPGEVQVLTSFTDVQDDRLEVSVYGWDARARGWLIGHWILWGDAPRKRSPVWDELTELLTRQFRTPRGMLGITAGGIDSGSGSHSGTVCDYVQAGRWQTRRQFATKGRSSRNGVYDPAPIWPQSVATKKGTATVVSVNVALAKLRVHMRLAQTEPSPFFNFPAQTSPALPSGFFDQLCAEELVRTSNAMGHTVKTFRLRKGIDRNEAWDCMVGAFAAFEGLNPARFPKPCGERDDLPPVTDYEPAAAPVRAEPKAPEAPQVPAPSKTPAPSRFAKGRDLWRRL